MTGFFLFVWSPGLKCSRRPLPSHVALVTCQSPLSRVRRLARKAARRHALREAPFNKRVEGPSGGVLRDVRPHGGVTHRQGKSAVVRPIVDRRQLQIDRAFLGGE